MLLEKKYRGSCPGYEIQVLQGKYIKFHKKYGDPNFLS